jgi:hypothetical protein
MGGFCSARQLVSDNDQENFVRVILNSLKIKKYSFSDVIFSLHNSENDEHFLKHCFENRKSEYHPFQEKLNPLRENLKNIGVATGDIGIYLFSLCSSKESKIKYLTKVFHITDFQKFASFLKIYLEINLIIFNSLIYDVLCKKFQGKLILGETFIDDMFKVNFNKLMSIVYSGYNLKIFYNYILESLKEIKENKLDEKGNYLISESDNFEINEEDLKKLDKLFPYLYDCIELRHYFFTKYYSGSF